MKEFKEIKQGLSVDRVCFYHGERIQAKTKLIRYYRCDIKYDKEFTGLKYSKDYNFTLINDLSISEDEIFSGFKSNYRNEIRRADKGDYTIEWFESKDILKDDKHLAEFEKLHEQMLTDKDKAELVQNYNHMQIMAFIEQKCFVLTRAESPDGGIVYHGYLCDGETAILQHSCSDFRNGTVNRTSAGRLNKLLHWEDMKHFKTLGYKIYDWGNTFDEGPDYTNGIDKFKAGFGGVSIKLVSAFKAASFVGMIATIARNWKMKRR